MGPCPVPGGGSRKPPALIQPRPLPASAGILPAAGVSAVAWMLVAERTPKMAAVINATRLKWSGGAIFNIERSSLWCKLWAAGDRVCGWIVVAQDNRTSLAPEARAGPTCSPDGAQRNPGAALPY